MTNFKDENDLLRNNPIFWSRLGFGYDPPLKNKDGKPLVFYENFEKYKHLHSLFAKQGVKLHTSILHAGWMGLNEYDYSLTDRTLDSIFSVDKDIFYIPRIKLNVPVDWCYENPEDVFVYYEGPRTADEIKSLVGTPKHDWFGYEAPQGYYLPEGDNFVDTRPNVGGVIGRQSLSSHKWLIDAGVALTKLIDHIENGPYGNRILGYHIGFGVSGESIHWGRASNHYGDYGINSLRNFYKFGFAKYGSEENLALKWDQPDISEDNVKLPSPDERYGHKENIFDFFRGNKEDAICEDYDEFISKSVADAILHFSKIAKEKTSGKLIGCFYGYFIHVGNASYAGHLDIERLLDSEFVDFFASPIPYYRRNCGEPSGEMCTTQSVNRKKVWVEELDIRTHLSREDLMKCNSLDETRTVMWREVAKNLSHDSGYWWMDLGDGWYDDDEIIKEIGALSDFNDEMRKKNHHSISDVLVVVDEKSMYKLGVNEELRLAFLEDFVCEAHLSGTLIDMYRLSDLKTLDLSQYKLVIFAYDFALSKEELSQFNFNKDAVFMFNYAAGVRSSGCSLENVKNLTGFEVCEYQDDAFDFPMLKIANESSSIKIVEGHTHILNVKPFMKAEEIRFIAKMANCHLYAPLDCAVYGDSRFIGIFSQSDINGTLKLTGKQVCRELICQNTYNENEIVLKMEENEARIFAFD